MRKAWIAGLVPLVVAALATPAAAGLLITYPTDF